MKILTKYISEDGEEFADEKACLMHEAEIKKLQWIVNSYGELGVRIDGVNYYLHKGTSWVYPPEINMPWRQVGETEFGEVCQAPSLTYDLEIYEDEEAVVKTKWATAFTWNKDN